LRGAAKACGPALYKKDASTVSSGDATELERVKKNFLIKKLGLKDSPKLDDAMAVPIATSIVLFSTTC